jgi:hypothetical protein
MNPVNELSTPLRIPLDDTRPYEVCSDYCPFLFEEGSAGRGAHVFTCRLFHAVLDWDNESGYMIDVYRCPSCRSSFGVPESE